MSDDLDEGLECEDCGEIIEVGEECYWFGLGADRALCLACAGRRGGIFSVDDGRWHALPRVDDLNP
jgi:hypothetical protein